MRRKDDNPSISRADLELFRTSVSGTRKLKYSERAEPPRPRKPKIELSSSKHQGDTVPKRSVEPTGERGIVIDTTDNHGGHIVFARGGIQQKKVNQLKKGIPAYRSTLDLHGMRGFEVESELECFVDEELDRGTHCILIIHGKGFHSKDHKGVVKPIAISWLKRHPRILAFCSAKPADGGTGAIYVLLKPY